MSFSRKLIVASMAILSSAGLAIAAGRSMQAREVAGPDASRSAARCGYHVVATAPDGANTRTDGPLMGADGAGVMSIAFKANFLDPALIASSHSQLATPTGGLLVTASRVNAADFRIEALGDRRPTYLREAPVLRIGDRWFVGDRVDLSVEDSHVRIGVDADFLDLLQRTRSFELWWRGVRRITVAFVPETLSPEAFGRGCIGLPSPLRAQLQPGNSNEVMREVEPASLSRLLGFISVGPATVLAFNPFDSDDRHSGNAAFHITVGRDGLVKECTITAARGAVPPRPVACDTVRRFTRYYPATSLSGQLIERSETLQLDWVRKS